ncbi:unnamed protein product [Ectocarpus sp. 6 AP-2014]
MPPKINTHTKQTRTHERFSIGQPVSAVDADKKKHTHARVRTSSPPLQILTSLHGQPISSVDATYSTHMHTDGFSLVSRSGRSMSSQQTRTYHATNHTGGSHDEKPCPGQIFLQKIYSTTGVFSSVSWSVSMVDANESNETNTFIMIVLTDSPKITQSTR